MNTKKDIVRDLKFCVILADKLVKTAENLKETPYTIYGKTPLENDITRLRRELNTVNRKLKGET